MGSTTSIEVRGSAALCALALSACASAPPPAFVPPLERMVVSAEFAERRGIKRRRHLGLDLRAARGTPVAAAAGGRVVFRGRQRGFGNVVIVDHGRGRTTYYAHLSDFAVGRAEGVRQGQTVGFVGRTGNATGPHLHFEVRVDGEPVDPRRFVAF